MTIAATVENYLIRHRSPYDVVAHAPTASSSDTAAVAHIPGERIAKGVVMRDHQGYIMVVVPATYYVKVNTVRTELGRDVDFATESELAELFPDCALGAVPALGPAYGLTTLLDHVLANQPEIYIEAGDHRELVHLVRDRFLGLLGPVERGQFSHPS